MGNFVAFLGTGSIRAAPVVLWGAVYLLCWWLTCRKFGTRYSIKRLAVAAALPFLALVAPIVTVIYVPYALAVAWMLAFPSILVDGAACLSQKVWKGKGGNGGGISGMP